MKFLVLTAILLLGAGCTPVADLSRDSSTCTKSAKVTVESSEANLDQDVSTFYYDIQLNGETVAPLTFDVPRTIAEFATAPGLTVIGESPSDLGGYIPYAGPMYLYLVDHCRKDVTRLWIPTPEGDEDEHPTSIATFFSDVSDDGKTFVFVRANEKRIGTMTLTSIEAEPEIQEWSAPGEDFTLLGDALLSPDGHSIAYVMGIGPEPEAGALYVLDTQTGQSRFIESQTGGLYFLNGWTSNETILIRGGGEINVSSTP